MFLPMPCLNAAHDDGICQEAEDDEPIEEPCRGDGAEHIERGHQHGGIEQVEKHHLDKVIPAIEEGFLDEESYHAN